MLVKLMLEEPLIITFTRRPQRIHSIQKGRIALGQNAGDASVFARTVTAVTWSKCTVTFIGPETVNCPVLGGAHGGEPLDCESNQAVLGAAASGELGAFGRARHDVCGAAFFDRGEGATVGVLGYSTS